MPTYLRHALTSKTPLVVAGGRQGCALLLFVLASACGGDDGTGIHDAGAQAAPDAVPGLTHDQIRKAGVIWGSCVPDDGIGAFIRAIYAGTIERSGLDPVELASCLASKRIGCAAIEECTPYRIMDDGPCERMCTGNAYSACDDAFHFRVDCAELGLACDPEEGCVDPDAELCDEETFQPECESGAPTLCGDGRIERGPVCADIGLECTPGGCRGTGEACETWNGGETIAEGEGLGCDGSTLEVCVERGSARLDCTELGPDLDCQRVPAATIDCEKVFHTNCNYDPPRDMFICGRGNECADDRTMTCQGTSVVFCDMGELVTVDCRSFGFKGCTEPFGCMPNNYLRVRFQQ